MNRKMMGSAILAACLALAGTSAFAQNRDSRHDHRGKSGAARHSQADRGHHGPRDVRRAPPPRPAARAYPRIHRGHTARPHHRFVRGARLPARYRARPYIIEDWRMRRLSPPPRGYYWVQAGGDFVLAAIATGIIAQIILNN